MKGYVLDTSVALALYLPESTSVTARGYWEKVQTTGLRCVVPSLHFLEFANALRTRIRRGLLMEQKARDIFDLHLDAGLEILEPNPRGLLDFALEFDATVYDAAYISLTLGTELTLLTAEKATKPWVARLGERALSVS